MPRCFRIGLWCFGVGSLASCGTSSPAASSPAVLVSATPHVELAASSSAAPVLPGEPTTEECEGQWTRYHDLVPNDPYVAHESFVERCKRCERAVLTCVDKSRDKVQALIRTVIAEQDGGVSKEEETAIMHGPALALGMIRDMGVCVTRERLRFALRSGELNKLVQDIAAKRLKPDEDGMVRGQGTYATLPSRGVVEEERGVLGPPGEIRVSLRSDGVVWLYFLGALLGRHQNQAGFLYSSRPFAVEDFERRDPQREQVHLSKGARDVNRTGRYLLDSFTVVDRLTPQLIEVAAAPD